MSRVCCKLTQKVWYDPQNVHGPSCDNKVADSIRSNSDLTSGEGFSASAARLLSIPLFPRNQFGITPESKYIFSRFFEEIAEALPS